MRISPEQLARTKRQEGYHKRLPDGRCAAYQERINGKLDRPTIGYGCTRNVHMGMLWTEAEAEAALLAELAIHEARVVHLVQVALTQGQLDALVDFDFNCGGLTDRRGAPSNVTEALNAGDPGRAADLMTHYDHFAGHPVAALTARRAENRAVFLADAAPSAPDTMPQDAEAGPPTLELFAAPGWSGVQAALHGSRTIFGVLVAALGWLLQQFDAAIGLIVDAWGELAHLGPLGLNVGAIGGGAVAIGLGLVVLRRLTAAHQGKVG